MTDTNLPADVTPGTETQTLSHGRNAWLVLVVLLLFSLTAPLNQFKVPPILPILMKEFELSIQQSGLLMSVYSLTGIILAVPAGFFLQKRGQRITGIIAGGVIVSGAVLGWVSKDVTTMLISRVIEGIGTSFMAVLAPAVIAGWFSERRRGTAMGVWSAWYPIGSSIMLLLAPWLAGAMGWQSVWRCGALAALAGILLFLIFVKPAPMQKDAVQVTAAPKVGLVLRNRNIWLLSLSFGLFTAAGMAFTTYTAAFLNTERGISLSQASSLVGLASIISIISCPLGGMLSDRLGVRKPLFIIGLLLMAAIMPLVAFMDAKIVIIQFILQGIAVGLVPTNMISSVVSVAGDERLSGLAMGALMVGQNAGMMLGPVVFGALAESGGWALAYLCLVPLYLLGAVCGWRTRLK